LKKSEWRQYKSHFKELIGVQDINSVFIA